MPHTSYSIIYNILLYTIIIFSLLYIIYLYSVLGLLFKLMMMVIEPSKQKILIYIFILKRGATR